jgi:hypothetical protein
MDVPQIPTSKQNRGIVARRPFQGGTQIQERIIETHKIIDVPIIHILDNNRKLTVKLTTMKIWKNNFKFKPI